MRPVITKFLPATDTKGARIKATSPGIGSITIGYDYALDTQMVHRKAFRALLAKFPLNLQSRDASDARPGLDRWVQESIKSGTHVFIPSFYAGVYCDFCAQTIDMPKA